MALEQNAPRETNLLPPAPQRAAEEIIQIPDCETAKEHAQTINHHEPHGLESLEVTHVLIFLSLLTGHRETLFFPSETIFFAGLAPFWAQGGLHSVHASEHDNCGEKCVGILVEYGILQVVIV